MLPLVRPEPRYPPPSSPVMQPEEQGKQTRSSSWIDFLVSCSNILILPHVTDQGNRFFFSNIFRESPQFASYFARGQFYKVCSSHSTDSKYHPLQRFQNSVRKFDVADILAGQINAHGNAAFYSAVAGEITAGGLSINHRPDLQRLDEITTLHASGEYLYSQICQTSGKEVAQLARERYLRGFSRVINAADHADWQALRSELLEGRHLGAQEGIPFTDDSMLFAISYKGSSVQITRRMYLLNEDGTRDEEEGLLLQESKKMTSDIVTDFRWSQIVRLCMTMAAEAGRSKVRIWLDRLVMMETPMDERERIYKILDWENFGLYAYVVCPVVRVYDTSEVEFGTDFWRKLETVMGIAACGLIVDSYMLRQYDKAIYYGPSQCSRHLNGVAVIGGGGVYIRGVTLAVATAVLTDAVSVAQANEDIRTVASIGGWKAWALRTIAEGAYSANHPFMMLKEEPFEVNLFNFKIIAFWESLITESSLLTGNSYMDISRLKSKQYHTSSRWDGVIEWIGRVRGSCVVRERESILSFLGDRVKVDLYAATTGHVASMLSLTSSGGHKRTIVVELARYSSPQIGYVTAIADATGLWGGSVLPRWLRFMPNSDVDQKAAINDDEGLIFTYYGMAMRLSVPWYWYLAIAVFGLAATILIIRSSIIAGVVVFLLFDCVLWYISLPFWASLLSWRRALWPWLDKEGVGEALFDNLLMHGLYDAGIKTIYRKLERRQYDQLIWY